MGTHTQHGLGQTATPPMTWTWTHLLRNLPAQYTTFHCSAVVRLLHQGRRMSEVVLENIAQVTPFLTHFIRVHVTQQYYLFCKGVV